MCFSLLYTIILHSEPEILDRNVMVQHRRKQGLFLFLTAMLHDPFLIMSGDRRGLQIHAVMNSLAKLCWCPF